MSPADEIADILRRRPDITRTNDVDPAVPAVIVSLPETMGGFEICVRHEPWGVQVDARRDRSFSQWQPVSHFGATVEVVQ